MGFAGLGVGTWIRLTLVGTADESTDTHYYEGEQEGEVAMHRLTAYATSGCTG